MRPRAFDEILDAAMPWDGGMILMLRAYFDASARPSGVFAVGGVAFGIDRAKKADREWQSAFDGRRFHMSDLHTRHGEFEGISDTDADRYCRAAVAIVNRFASAVVAISCDVEEVERLRPKGPEFEHQEVTDIARSAYNCCLHWSMMALGGIFGDGQRIQYWFERGDNFQSASRRFLETLNNPDYEPMRRSYCYGSDAFVAKADAPLFDAADLVAWEWGKHIERLRAGKTTRPSLAALMGDQCVANGKPTFMSRAHRRGAMHASGESLERFFRKFKAVSLARSQEEVRAALQMN